ncbi:open rectifier potassium channel protein 1 [Topomyia yanbarensis]|uniref:open rectifier potassium channel protein 1 n=1 Tax=Topomyia yanbarensis TaxID=2498891 RepID=UPI00273B37E2|nr:open rectifier potassium channel protein 1 [Topomyia yanbarensis]XP_058824874.1 open rectifier potassium channel protein 1 [Topomyia yanbarensis]
MTPKEWFALFAFYAAYLFFGASVFYHNEHALETVRRADELAERIEMNELLTKYLAPEDRELQNELIDRLSEYCEKKVTNHTLDKFDPPYVWNFYHSFYFAFIVCSTIGYGNISPNNTFGRIFMIFYALIGLPVNGFFFAYLGDFYGKTYIRLYRRYKAYKLSANSHYVPRKLSLIGQIILYLIPGIVIFIFIPGCIFCYFEKWPYDVGVYYAFVTLTTIGFGDYTSTFEPSQQHEFGKVFVVYQIFVVLWFFAGVGYVFMILGFIAKGLAHKKVQRLQKLLALNVMETQQRVWNGVTKDVSYLRKILNEVYMLKFKPVYNEPADRYIGANIGRSESCPELTMYQGPEFDPIEIARKRARSMCVPDGDLLEKSKSTVSVSSIGRRLSDTDLNRINREKTFGIQAMIQPAELLARVVTALGNITTIDEDRQSILEQASNTAGINCFSDSQILNSERTSSGWSMAGFEKNSYLAPPPMRPRASSDIGLPPIHPPTNLNDWTWSVGDNIQIKEMMKVRQKAQKSRDNLLRAAISNSKQYGSNNSVRDEFQPPASTTNRTLLQRLNPFRKRSTASESRKNSVFDAEAPRPVNSYLAQTAKGRASMFAYPPQQYLTATATGRRSLFSLPTNDEHQVLETTTIGDLIRALEIMHSQATMPSAEVISEQYESPKRKIGTATPPKVPSLMNLFTNTVQDTGPRRGSLKVPIGGQSFNNPLQPSLLNPNPAPPENPPPYSTATGYSSSPIPIRRRFSVRPSSLAFPPGQCPRSGSVSLDNNSPPTASSASLYIPTTTLQRRLSARPSPLSNQNQSLLQVPSMIGSLGTIASGSSLKPKPWRPTLLRSDSEHPVAPTPTQQTPVLRPRTRHSSLGQMEYRKRTDSS